MEISLTQEDGSALPVDSYCGFVNNVLHTVIKRQSIYLNDKCINSSGDSFNYKQYIDTMTTYNNGCKKSVLESQGYYPDTPSKVRLRDNINFYFLRLCLF